MNHMENYSILQGQTHNYNIVWTGEKNKNKFRDSHLRTHQWRLIIWKWPPDISSGRKVVGSVLKS